nr:protein NUCLEAR FUSION DEFECTIVE 6, chloroplastic/mitochondrial-like isoform X1 [Ipomoea batatas]
MAVIVVLQIELALGSGEARGPEIRVHGERLEREEDDGWVEREMEKNIGKREECPKGWKPVRQPRDHPNHEPMAENDPLRFCPVKNLHSHDSFDANSEKEKDWKPVRQPRDHPNHESTAENDPLLTRPAKELKDTEVQAYRTDPVQSRTSRSVNQNPRENMAAIAAKSVFCSAAISARAAATSSIRTAATRAAAGAKRTTSASPFAIPTQRPLTSRIFR